MKRETCAAFIACLILSCGAATPALASGADDFGPSVVLPSASSLISIARAAQTIQAQAPGATILRVQLELEGARWVYKGELGTSGARSRIRVMIDARTGAFMRLRRETPGGSDQRTMLAVLQAGNAVRVTPAQAATIASAATSGQLVTDVRLDLDRGALVWKVTTHAATVRSEVRLNVTSGAVIRISHDGTSTPPPPPGGGGTGNTPPSGGGGGGGGNGGGTAPPPPPSGGTVVLTGNAASLDAAILAALNGQPSTFTVIEAKFKRLRYTTQIEVLLGADGSAYGQEVYVNPANRAVVRERETLDADDAGVLAAFADAVQGESPIGHARAMAAAVAATGGEVTDVEIGMRGAAPIYEIKTVAGMRVWSVKVNALTGAVIEF